MNDNELMHYGVLGMKWGVRRGRSDKVYVKAQKKMAKLDRKVDKYQRKSTSMPILLSELRSVMVCTEAQPESMTKLKLRQLSGTNSLRKFLAIRK